MYSLANSLPFVVVGNHCLFRRTVADARVAPLSIVEDLDILEQRGPGLAPGGELVPVHELGFE